MVVKSKISKAKRNNQKKNKLCKQGVIQKAKKTNKLSQKIPKIVPVNKHVEESEESDDGQDMLDMVEEGDLDFLRNAITNQSYTILNKLRRSEFSGPKSKKLKTNFEETVEEGYEDKYERDVQDQDDGKRLRNLLPIKTKKGVVQQHVMENIKDDDQSDPEAKKDIEESDHEELETRDLDLVDSVPISEIQLLAARSGALQERKIHIGTLCSGLLENPEEKITNLRTLLTIMDEETPEIFFTVRKLVVVSLLEVFKDIFPSYEIKQYKQDGVKLKKDTLKLQKYEESLLVYYKKYLQKLEKYSSSIFKKRGDSRVRTDEETKLGILSLRTMCDLLVSHPYFNYSQNIAQATVPFLNSHNKEVREIVKTCVMTVFKEDKREEITLKILRIINSYMKNHSHNVHVDMLEVLLVLNLKDVDLNQEEEHNAKQKRLMNHKSRILQLSKKERKRKKKLKEVEKELLETKAEENHQAKLKNLTEITKIVFNIYFRILKTSSSTKILGITLEGLAKFAHCINLEFYVDIVNILNNLLKEDWLGYREQLHCIQTVFAILSGHGEAFNLDPTRFYNSLYKDLLTTSAASRKSEHVLVLIKTLYDALVKRRKKITNNRIIGFAKRLSTLSLQFTHDGALGCLGLVRCAMQSNRSIDILLDLDCAVGEGKFQAELDDPEYSNASSTALYELILLRRHYHPVINKFARHIASGIPATGDGSLPGEYGKCSPEQLFIKFNMSEMAFYPPVAIPKRYNQK